MNVYDTIISCTSIQKGWSGDRKYCAVTADGSKYLLRISPVDTLERKRMEFEKMLELSSLGIPMCQPIEFGTCEEGVYAIHSWVEGEDAEEAIIAMDEESRYRYGLEAGRILAKIHSIPAPADAPDWEVRFNAKIDRKISMYEKCSLKYENGDAFLNYLSENRHLLKDRPQSYQHGDYHVGNMMIDMDGRLTIIDFEKQDVGDPWEEFNRIVWSAQTAPAFASGMVDGYFDGDVPIAFWRLLALYICSNTLGSLPWAIPFGDGEVAVMRDQAAQVLAWYDGMHAVVPGWYRENSAAQAGTKLRVAFHDRVEDSLLKFAVIISRHRGKWVFCKHKERDTYEIPGGHRESGESILDAAKRELKEETGAVDFDMRPVCAYSVTGKNRVNESGETSYGMLFYAEIHSFETELHSEMEAVYLFDEMPGELTYPQIQPLLMQEYQRWLLG